MSQKSQSTMKTGTKLAAFALLLSTTFPQLSTVLAQGSLTPPGAPAQTMKSLDQVEPRTIVNSANTPGDSNESFIISQPGSYYLAANLAGVGGKNGIFITTNNVSLDLNGFALLGTGTGGAYGVYVSGSRTNIIVRNGNISGWGVGIYGFPNYNMLCERLTVSSCSIDGILVSGSGIIANCTIQSCGAIGIYAVSSTVSGCTVQSCGTSGIYALSSTVSGCLVIGGAGSGIYVSGPGCVIVGNTCTGDNSSASSSGAGIYITDSNNRIEGNHVTASGYAGIQVSSFTSNNFVIRNTVTGNGGNNYLTPGSQIVGPLITSTASGIITNSNPWANFSF
jgi:parallel beta-helix repeat protein